MNVEREPRKKIGPFKIEKYLKAKFGIDVSDINVNVRGCISRVESEQQTRELLGMKSLLDAPCTAAMHNLFNESKELIYIQEYDVTNFDTFKTGLEAR